MRTHACANARGGGCRDPGVAGVAGEGPGPLFRVESTTTTITTYRGRSVFLRNKFSKSYPATSPFTGGSLITHRVVTYPFPATPPNVVRKHHLHGIPATLDTNTTSIIIIIGDTFLNSGNNTHPKMDCPRTHVRTLAWTCIYNMQTYTCSETYKRLFSHGTWALTKGARKEESGPGGTRGGLKPISLTNL